MLFNVSGMPSLISGRFKNSLCYGGSFRMVFRGRIGYLFEIMVPGPLDTLGGGLGTDARRALFTFRSGGTLFLWSGSG